MNLLPIKDIATKIQIALGQELINLKRNASGALINSLQHQITQQGEFGFVLKILANKYWREVNYGVSAERVPYDARIKSGAQSSEYINGLMNWIKTKGIASDDDTIRGIAFAIATKQTSTSRGGFGLGNPMDKQKLGFVERSQPQINKELQNVAKIYQSEVFKIIGDRLPKNMEIIL